MRNSIRSGGRRSSTSSVAIWRSPSPGTTRGSANDGAIPRGLGARRSIIHTDLRVGNIVVGPGGLRAVLDWEGARRFGDPMRDLAWPTLRMWRFGDDAREFGGLVDLATFVAAYERAGGTFELDRFRWWKTASTLAWGVLLAGQAAAYLDGATRDIVMAASGRRVSEIEWDLLMQIRPAS
ncbi:phosphotransferase [Nocardia amikacinitolerans]|uniref:phosphotransferase n=1 Tax=Nocardia amikacinitolerans TaxID=756689 RepID=UPI0036D1A3A8